MSILYRFRVIVRFSSKVTNLTHPTCICRPHRGWSLSNFAMNFGVRKLESRGYRLVRRYLRDPTFSRFDTIPECDRHTHTQTDRHTTTVYTALSKASRGKNITGLLQLPKYSELLCNFFWKTDHSNSISFLQKKFWPKFEMREYCRQHIVAQRWMLAHLRTGGLVGCVLNMAVTSAWPSAVHRYRT